MTKQPPKYTKTQVALTLAQGVLVNTLGAPTKCPNPRLTGGQLTPKVRSPVESII